MQQILSLSQCDKNFIREVPAELNDYINFKLQLFVPQAMRLLAIDHNLANVINCFASTKNKEIFFPLDSCKSFSKNGRGNFLEELLQQNYIFEVGIYDI